MKNKVIRKTNLEKLVITGAPLIGEGNIVDNKAFIAVLARAGIPSIGFYPNSPLVWLGKWLHIEITMSTKKTMDYTLNSEIMRSSFRVLPLKWELRRAIRKAHKAYSHATCFITSQSMMAEESVGCIGDIPTLMISSDVSGKLNHDSNLSERQQRIIYLVWNREALHLYKNELNLQNVHLIRPVDPKNAFKHIKKVDLPFQEALVEPNLCFIKLSGSGGDPKLINTAIISLWNKSKTRSIVFPGIRKTQRRIIKKLRKNVIVNSSLDAAVFYNQVREMISNEQMLLTYPSEQVKHLAVLTQNNILPKVVWLPPRGNHEIINLAWAIKQGFSRTICVPKEYQGQLNSSFIKLDVHPLKIEFVEPDMLSAEHFKLSPVWQCVTKAASLENIIQKVGSVN